MEEQVNNFRWIPFVAAILLAVLVGAVAYNAGLAHGITQSGKIVVAPGSPAAVPYPYAYPYYGWHAWGGFFYLPFFFIFMVFGLIRMLCWRGGMYRGRCGYRDLDEWHKQAHERTP
jgi:hypothetical protein